MNVFLIILSYFLVASLTFILGFFTIKKMQSYSGTMKVIRDENKVLYSLELDEDPVMLEHKSEVVFRVETSDQSSDRK